MVVFIAGAWVVVCCLFYCVLFISYDWCWFDSVV